MRLKQVYKTEMHTVRIFRLNIVIKILISGQKARKYGQKMPLENNNHIPQSKQRHHKEDTQNTNSINNKSEATSSLSLFLSEMIAKLEKLLSK